MIKGESAPGSRIGDENLFRAEALKAFGERAYGRPIARTPRLWAALAGSLVVIVGATGLFVATSTYARKERVVGWLMPDQGLVRLSAGRHGQVERINVDEGDLIEKGAPLLVLATDTGVEGGGRATDALITELDREAEEAKRQLDLLSEGNAVEQASIEEAIDHMVIERSRLHGQLEAQAERVQIASDVAERFRSGLADARSAA